MIPRPPLCRLAVKGIVRKRTMRRQAAAAFQMKVSLIMMLLSAGQSAASSVYLEAATAQSCARLYRTAGRSNTKLDLKWPIGPCAPPLTDDGDTGPLVGAFSISHAPPLPFVRDAQGDPAHAGIHRMTNARHSGSQLKVDAGLDRSCTSHRRRPRVRCAARPFAGAH